MKYFTKEWWQAGCPDANILFQKYDAYLAQVKGSIPNELLKLHDDYTLHDAEVKRVLSDCSNRTIEFVLHGWNRELSAPLIYKLRFTEVSTFEQIFPQQEYVESELGDLGYWEIQALESELEVKMLFVSEAEFHLRFKGFSFVQEPRTIEEI